MKTIRVDFCGFWVGFNKENNFIYNVLKQKYEVIIDEIHPDYAFISCFIKPFEWTKYDCIRIFWAGEPTSADFLSFDYYIGFDYIDFGDRYIRYPYFMLEYNPAKRLNHISKVEVSKLLESKKYFCNFIYSHKSSQGVREEIFKALSAYKHVESVGTFWNNSEDNTTVTYCHDKIAFVKKCKFTIAGESISYPGFTTEKIADAFMANSIPIYSGDPLVSKVFNPKAFINTNDYKNIEDVVQKVIEIDNDDGMYLSMLLENPFVDDSYYKLTQEKFEQFLFHIVDQEPKKAFRRILDYYPGNVNRWGNDYYRISNNKHLLRINNFLK